MNLARSKSTNLRRLAMAACALTLAAGARGQGGGADTPGADAESRAVESAAPANGFLRVAAADDGTPRALQTSIVTYRRPAGGDGVVVDLVGAVHIGDARYYDELNERFVGYDAVLYELVAPEGTRVPLGGVETGGGVVSGAQLAMTRVLDLEFQLNRIDYTRENLIHADLSPDEITRSMAVRGESVYQYLWKLFGMAMSEYAHDPYGTRNVSLLAALFSEEPERMLKVQFAATMLDMDTMTSLLEGENGSTLLGERNRRAVEVLAERIRLGDRRLAIFYGAAHMADMAERLESELGLVRDDAIWVDAWDLL
jgi:hypothetical protein